MKSDIIVIILTLLSHFMTVIISLKMSNKDVKRLTSFTTGNVQKTRENLGKKPISSQDFNPNSYLVESAGMMS